MSPSSFKAFAWIESWTRELRSLCLFLRAMLASVSSRIFSEVDLDFAFLTDFPPLLLFFDNRRGSFLGPLILYFFFSEAFDDGR